MSSSTVMVAVTTLPTFMAASGMETAVMTGKLASIASAAPAGETFPVKAALGLVAESVRTKLATGTLASAATFVPLSVTVKVAV